MELLIVDDQISVLDGILSGVRFRELGIDIVHSATNVQEALNILSSNKIDIVLSDIEMPGQSGLELTKIIQEKYPAIYRILLTSHAEFSFAQESLRLGCFDYLLQPCPYDVIEDSLSRALQQIYQERKKERLYHYGQLFETNETELMNHVVTKLFSRDPQEATSSIKFLNDMGYPLKNDKLVQTIIVDVDDFKNSQHPVYSEKSIHKAISNALAAATITYPILSLTAVNLFRQFALVLFSAANDPIAIPATKYTAFFENLKQLLNTEEIICYVGNWVPCSALRPEIRRIHLFADENVGNERGVFHTSGEEISGEAKSNLEESLERWKKMFTSGQKRMLQTEIEDFIKRAVDKGSHKLWSLSELHRQLNHIFFSYLYENEADMSALFTQEYTYAEYMNSFKDLDSFRKGVGFMLDAIDGLQKTTGVKSDIELAKTFITENVSRSITVKDVADHVNLSPEYFTKQFKRATGQNIKEYIDRSKVATAKEMLEHSNISVSMIASELGYSYFSHFTQVFKKYEKVTPSEYRNNLPG